MEGVVLDKEKYTEKDVLEKSRNCLQTAWSWSWMKQRKLDIWRVVGVATACLCITVSSSMYAFNAYSNGLKYYFGLTQFQVEIISSLASLGNNIALPAGLMQEKLGHRWTLVFSLSITFTVLMLLWSAQYHLLFYTQHVWILYIYFFLLGFGAICGFMAVYPVVLLNFSAAKRGCITSLMGTFLTVGPAVFAAIYGGFFVLGNNNGLWGYFLFTALAFVFAFSLGMIFVRPIRDTVEPFSEHSALLVETKDTEMEGQTDAETKDITGWALLREPDFYSIMGSFVCSVSLQYSFINNIPTVLKSFDAQTYNTFFTVLAPIVSSVAKLGLGVLSDLTLSKIPRVVYQLVSNTLQTLFLLFCFFYIENIPYFLVTTLIVSIGSGVMTSQTASRIADSFGTKYFSRNFGFSFLGVGIGIFVLQLIFGALYDANADRDKVCRGRRCFIWSFVLFFVFSFISALLDAWGLFVYFRRQSKADVSEENSGTNS